MSNQEREGASNAIKDFIQTISPFVSIAMILIGFIYTSQMRDNQDATNDLVKEVREMRKDMEELKNGQTQITGRIERHGEQLGEDKTSIKDLQTRQNDLEKTVILSNANRK